MPWPVVADTVTFTRNSTGTPSRIGTSSTTTVSIASSSVKTSCSGGQLPSASGEPGWLDWQPAVSVPLPKPFCQDTKTAPVTSSGRRR
jgi:hypothetical protein